MITIRRTLNKKKPICIELSQTDLLEIIDYIEGGINFYKNSNNTRMKNFVEGADRIFFKEIDSYTQLTSHR